MLGSPPLTRETRLTLSVTYQSVRITPAHAGNTSSAIQRRQSLTGSPPLTRETLEFAIYVTRSFRITPAHAGNTLTIESVTSKEEDHPRSRGKHNSLPIFLTRILGSPPLTRETPTEHHRAACIDGITPAHAGNTDPQLLLPHHL